MQKIELFNVGFLDSNYNNTIYFENYNQQSAWFTNHNTKKEIEINMIQDAMQYTLTVPSHWTAYCTSNYLRFLYGGRYFYYFITNYEQVTENTTLLYIQLDVFMTHCFDIVLYDTFVDRCHVDRWSGDKPTRHTIDEGLDCGELIMIGEPYQVADFNDTVIIASSVPMGELPTSDGGGGGGGGGDDDCGDWQNGILSSTGFRFIKGFEGFAPRAYQDSGGYWTIAYGVTKHGEPDIYDDLVSKQPVNETDGAKVSYNLKNDRYGKKIVSAVKALGCTEQRQFDALCSVAYNSGNGSITGSNTLTTAIKKNPTDESTIRPVWEKFKITSSGVELEGLKKRRKQECNLYFGKPHEVRKIPIIGTSGNVTGDYVTANNGDGWLPTCDTAPGGIQEKILNSARKLLGKPYVWGGNYPPLGNSDGTDCSGLCMWAYNDNGLVNVVPGRWTTSTMDDHGTAVSQSNIKIADCILTPGHVVMYAGFRDGNHYIIEAPRTGLNVRERIYEFPSNITSIRRYV